MISELNDQEILDFLMTSEYEGDYSPEELKYLLVKWRYFYRIINGKLERAIDEKQSDLRVFIENQEKNTTQINTLQRQIVEKDEIINSLKSRKLNWKERISGKINHIENENR